jgi:peroxiredoxin
MTRNLVTWALLVVLAAPALADGVAVGAEAPAFEGREFINTPPVKLADLKGHVVVLELFKTSSQQCGEQVARLDELLAKHGDRGLVVLAVTNEERKAVDEFVAKWKPKHGIVIESGDSSKTYGLAKGYPTAYVIGADGKIAWTGNWADQADLKIDFMLPKAKRSPPLPARLAAVRDAAEKSRYMDARGALEAEIKAGTVGPDERPAVDKMIAWIDQELTKQLLDAAKLADDGKYYESAIELERLAKECAGHDVGKRAADGLKQLLSEPGRKREVDAGRQLAAAVESAKALAPKKAIPLYKAVITKWKDTKAAKQAAELITAAEAADAGKPK